MPPIESRRGGADRAVPSVPGTPTPPETLDRAVADVRARKDDWVRLNPGRRIALLDRMARGIAAGANAWIEASVEAKGIDPASATVAEEWLAGPYCVLRNLRLLRRSLADIAAGGQPRIPGPVTTRGGGQVVARVFPTDLFDRLLFPGYTAEVWMEPGVTRDGLKETQATAYGPGAREGKVALVLGAGNMPAIGPTDVLHKLFVENRVVVLKTSPVNAYLGPHLAEAFRAPIEEGFLRIVDGGAAEGEYLCSHAGVDEIHVTGSDRTYDAIVFGGGEEGARRKAAGTPLRSKPVTAELGNVSPVIVVPGPWTRRDLEFHAANIASQLVANAGFYCNSARVIVQHASWDLRAALLDEVRRVLSSVPPRRAYYPGAAERHAAFLAEHPGAERFGVPSAGELPWTLVAGVDPGRRDDICFRTEAFSSLFAETALHAADVGEFLDRATAFCNETLWGSLCATVLVHPASLADPKIASAVERMVADLRYGAVSLNPWAALAYTLGTTTWGAFPGNDPGEIGSGTGVVHNTLMFSRVQKTVVRGPFRAWPLPPWFVTSRGAARLSEKLARFEASPSVTKLPGILAAALRG